ncbi:MAG: hypothetical protein KDK99_13985, partial [Verrucomicrobiales bacterium]|nr:hypothetical protein [Verrucomicrobiales bacterium]
LGAVIVHVAALILFGLWTVARQFRQPEAVFEVRESLKIPVQQTPQHKMNAAQHQAAAPKPTPMDKLISTRPTKFALPELPKLDLQQMLPLDPSELVSDQVASLVGTAGFGNSGTGLSGAGGLGKALSKFSFMGIQAEGQRIVLCFDVSGSVVNKATASGMPLTRIKEETIKLLDSLPPAAGFSIIQFVRNYKPFSPQLVQATPANRDAAKNWINTEWSESGQMAAGGKGVLSPNPNGIPAVLDAAFAMNPDVIFLISDGSFQQTYPQDRTVPVEEVEKQIKTLQKGRAKEVPLHFIGFEMRNEDENAWTRIARRSGGRLRQIKP